jgi:hypothetical protein
MTEVKVMRPPETDPYPACPRSPDLVCSKCGASAVINTTLGLSWCSKHEYNYPLVDRKVYEDAERR